MDLRVAGVSEISAVAIHLHSCRTVGSHGVGGEEEGVSVTTRTYYYRMSEETLDAAGYEVTGDDTTRTLLAVLIRNEDDVQHLVASVHLHFAFADLAAQCAVCAKKQLLSGLTFCVEGTGNLCATERTVVQQTSVLACERNTLRHALVDDVIADFRQTIYVRLACAVVATLDGVIIETIDGVTIVLVVLRRVDTTLRSNRVRTTGAVLNTEVQHIESHLCEGRSSRRSGKTGTYHDDVQTAFVSRVHQFLVVLVIGPFQLQRSLRDLRILRSDDRSRCLFDSLCGSSLNLLGYFCRLVQHFLCHVQSCLCCLHCYFFRSV